MPIDISRITTDQLKPNFIQVNEVAQGHPVATIASANGSVLELPNTYSVAAVGNTNRPLAQLWGAIKYLADAFLVSHEVDGTFDYSLILSQLNDLTNANIDPNAGIVESKLALEFVTQLIPRPLDIAGTYGDIDPGPGVVPGTTATLAQDLYDLWIRVRNNESYQAGESRRIPRFMKTGVYSGWIPPHHNGEQKGIGYVQGYLGGLHTGSTGDSVARSGYDGTFYVPEGTINTNPLTDLLDTGTVSDKNIIALSGAKELKCIVNGNVIEVEGRLTKGHRLLVPLPDPPSSGGRRDLVIMEVWRENVDPRDPNGDCFFPFGNVMYDFTGEETTVDGCTLLNVNQPLPPYPDYLGTGRVFGVDFGQYVSATDVNIEQFLLNPEHNVGVFPSGQFYQVRWRIRVLEDIHDDALNSALLYDSTGNNYFLPRGKKATLVSETSSSQTNAEGIFVKQVGGNVAQETVYDPGMYIGAKYNGTNAVMTEISSLADEDGMVFAIPLCLVHRRVTGTWAINDTNAGMDLSTAIAGDGISDRPDGLFSDLIAERDILDIRHRIFPAGYDDHELLEESLQLLLSGNLKTTWEELKTNAAGCSPTFQTDTYGTTLHRIEGIVGTGIVNFDPSWQVLLKSITSNERGALFDGLRNYYSDVAGEQKMLCVNPDCDVDLTVPNSAFSFTATPAGGSYNHKTFTFDLSDLNAYVGMGAYAPSIGGKDPEIWWGCAARVNNRRGRPNKVRTVFVPALPTTVSGYVVEKTTVVVKLNASVTITSGTTYDNAGLTLTVIGRYGSGATSDYYTFEFIGSPTQVPVAATWNFIAGTGPATITIAAATDVFIGHSHDSMTDTEQLGTYIGEGWAIHTGAVNVAQRVIYMAVYVLFAEGSGWQSSPTIDSQGLLGSLDGIKKSEYWIESLAPALPSTQVLPDDGTGFIPYGTVVDSRYMDGGIPDPHTRSFGFVGWNRRDPVVDLGTLVGPNPISSYNAQKPTVLKVAASEYKMWYSLYDGVSYHIAYATSVDGLTWTDHQIVITAGSGENLMYPCVIREGAVYYIFYTVQTAPTTSEIFRATSNDGGITWTGTTLDLTIPSGSAPPTMLAGIPTDTFFNAATGVGYCSVVRKPGLWEMWYTVIGTGINPIHKIYRAKKTLVSDAAWIEAVLAINNNIHGIYDDIGVIASQVIWDGNVYKIWYEGISSIAEVPKKLLYASSGDGMGWAEHMLVLSENAGVRYGDLGASGICVIKDGPSYRYWYTGKATNVLVPSNPEYRIYAGVFSMFDPSHIGSPVVSTDWANYYTTAGFLNFAPSIYCQTLMFYDTPARQSTMSWFETGVDFNYKVKYLDRVGGYQTSLGTGGVPRTRVYSKYRDFAFYFWGLDTFKLKGQYFETATADPHLGIGGQIGPWKTFRPGVEFFPDGDRIPTAQDMVVLDGFQKIFYLGREVAIYKIGWYGLGEGSLRVYYPDEANSFYMLPVLIEKNQNLLLMACSNIMDLDNIVQPSNEFVAVGADNVTVLELVGHPLTKTL